MKKMISVAALVLCFAAAACKEENTTASTSADDRLGAKLQAYVVCINRIDSTFRTKYPSYREFFDLQLEALNPKPASNDPTERMAQIRKQYPKIGRDTYRRGAGFKIAVFETNNEFTRGCADGLKKAVADAPADADLDRIGAVYAETLTKLIPIMNAADSYYKQEDDRDDHMVKGKAFDTELAPLFTTLLAAGDEMRSVVANRKEALQVRRLDELEKTKGKTFEWQAENAMLQARHAVDGVREALDSEPPSTEKVLANEQKLQAAYDAAKAYGDAHQDEKTSRGNKPTWFYLESNVSNVLTQIKDLRRKLTASNGDSAKSKAGQNSTEDLGRSFDRIISDYNSLVEQYNRFANIH